MKIAVISVWYNEELLAPLFLKHYGFADSIFILLDRDTTDSTKAISGRSNSVIEEFTFPNKFDDGIKIDAINKKAAEIKRDFDWIIAVDADEFLFIQDFSSVRTYLEQAKTEVLLSRLDNVYRHRSDLDLDYTGDITQRRHGIKSPYCCFKPCVVKTSLEIQWGVGCHRLVKGDSAPKGIISGAHWAMADPGLAVNRRAGRYSRLSKRSIAAGWCGHYRGVTTESLLADCQKHLDDPLLF